MTSCFGGSTPILGLKRITLLQPKVMTHTWVMDNNCVKYYLDQTWQWGVMARRLILGMCALWLWPWRYDLRSRSRHTHGSWTTIAWNIIQIGQGGKKLWPGHDLNRRTDGQTGWFLYNPPSQILFKGGIINKERTPLVRLKKTWSSKNICRNTEFRLYNSLVIQS